MFQLCNEVKVLRDPIHGYVSIRHQVVWDCLNSKEFQRLRRIRQLGGACMVYHTADHSRFAHSLGVYEIVRKMVEENQSVAEAISEEDRVVAMLAGLLHDLGHGPYSHSFELISKVSHETMTTRIIEGNSELHEILEKARVGLSAKVADVIRGEYPNPILVQMISGQLDADRMDYLLRDAYFTGTKYGEFDIQRVLRTIRVQNDTLVVKASGMHSVEDYIMARYHMYWQVYYHPTARSYELLMKAFFMRLKDCLKDEEIMQCFPLFKVCFEAEEMTVEQHYTLDEACFNYGISCFLNCKEQILRDLAHRIIDRDLFGYEDYRDQNQVEELRARCKENGYDPKYYLLSDEARQQPYVPYKGMIYVLNDQGEIKELSECSYLVTALVQGKALNDSKLYYPKELFTEK